jgi:release factor glutamine methyltransferase
MFICQLDVAVIFVTLAAMTYGEWLLRATETLEKSGSKTPRLDALLLLEMVSGRSRADLIASGKEKLSVMRQGKLKALLARRVDGEPMAYIAGQKEFHGRDFIVNKWVLVPRPESEAFLTLLKYLRDHKKEISEVRPLKTEKYGVGGFLHTVADIGTGSGNLAITAKLEFPDLYVFATDTSKEALQIAAQNALRHNAAIVFKEQNLLHGDKEGYDLVMANLPYVPTGPEPDPSIAHEPVEALFSGFDGLEHYRRFFTQLAPKHIRFVMTESLLTQHKALKEMAADAGYKLAKTEGLVQLFVKNTPETF